MNIAFFIVCIIGIVVLCGGIFYFKWVLKTYYFSKNPKIQRGAEIAMKGLIMAFYGALAYLSLEVVLCVLSPLVNFLNAAVAVAVDRLFTFIGNIVPIAVIWYFISEWLKSRKVNVPEEPKKPNELDLQVKAELARQKAKSQYPTVLSFMFRVFVAVSQEGIIPRKYDPHDIETASASNTHFYMSKTTPVFEFEIEISDEEAMTEAKADEIRDKLQDSGIRYINDYPSLISPDSEGESPFEVLSVQPLGRRIHVEVVFTTSDSLDLITRTRYARVERQLQQKQSRPNPRDPLFR